MPQVNVTIAGRSYRMGCDDGQEEALIALAADLDSRLTTFRQHFGEIGDMRLMIMTALQIADELDEIKERTASLERETQAARAERQHALERAQSVESYYASALDEAATRVEKLTRALATGDIEG